ncbi:hypothetical protein [Nocardioides okcheonensis]|uniref:hypothetical protein n=1 Tax=Nocardioides okcheonensis TaxID=2894081 RepID=UPI001E5D6EE5|nr:hypothetical protein [Nocardioides okcheonensis]UFN43651.1 hypothetical protein LN652_16625 [Nocardioides okcheonensis]
MRTVLKFQVQGDVKIYEPLLGALDETGWTHAKIDLSHETLVGLAKRVLDKVRRAGQDLPVSPDSRFIQTVITDHDKGPDRRFEQFTFEHTALSQALLLLVQIPLDERDEAFQRDMVVIKSQENVYGILFLDPPAVETRTHSLQARLRSPDLGALQRATAEFVGALSPAKRGPADARVFTSRGAAVRRGGHARLFTTSFASIQVRSVTNELLMTGQAIPINGRLSLIWQSVNRSAGRVLLGISLSLVAVSAALFAFSPDTGWWAWTEQLAGRLATGAFGALLVDGALDYTALRQALLKGSGDVTHGAVVEWARA